MNGRLATIEEHEAWLQLPGQLEPLAVKLAAAAYDIRKTVSTLYTPQPVGVWLHKQGNCAAYEGEDPGILSSALVPVLVKAGISLQPHTLSDKQVQSGDWVKVAYSPALRKALETIQFFPGQYPGGVTHGHGPVRSMLVGGLLGAGLGYGAGWLGERVLLNDWRRRRLRRTLATVGGLLGVAPGAIASYANLRQGLPLNEGSAYADPPGSHPSLRVKEVKSSDLSGQWQHYTRRIREHPGDEPLVKEARTMFGPIRPVNVDSLGRTLWQSGTDPQTAGTTMGTLAAAQQMPGGINRPGWVTPTQMGHLAAGMGSGYVSGALVGAVLGALTGMPPKTQEKLRQTGAYVGVVKTVMPRMFGY